MGYRKSVWSEMSAAPHRTWTDSRFPRSQAALDLFDPLLVELVRADAPLRTLTEEGFTHFEVSAVRTLVGRVDTARSVSTGDARSATVGSNSQLACT